MSKRQRLDYFRYAGSRYQSGVRLLLIVGLQPRRSVSWARCGAGCQLRPLLGVAGAWAQKMLPSAIMPSRWSCLSSQILNQNVMRLQQLARGVLDGGYCKLVGHLRLQNA